MEREPIGSNCQLGWRWAVSRLRSEYSVVPGNWFKYPSGYCFDRERVDSSTATARRHQSWTTPRHSWRRRMGSSLRSIPSGEVDEMTCRRLVALANGRVSFHRAFDFTNDSFDALERLIVLGFRRVLTSGGRSQRPRRGGTNCGTLQTSRGTYRGLARRRIELRTWRKSYGLLAAIRFTPRRELPEWITACPVISRCPWQWGPMPEVRFQQPMPTWWPHCEANWIARLH